jgi:hypothetical protein
MGFPPALVLAPAPDPQVAPQVKNDEEAMPWLKDNKAVRGTRIWRTEHRRNRLLLRNHDSLFIALGRWRLRIMKPGYYQRLTRRHAK